MLLFGILNPSYHLWEGNDTDSMNENSKASREFFLIALGLTLASALPAATYRYDRLGRLQQVKYSASSGVTYTYDAAGNLTKVISGLEPTLVSLVSGSASPTSARVGGDVLADGGHYVHTRGIVVADHTDPKFSVDPTFLSSPGTGQFSVDLAALTEGKTYFFRSFAINTVGIAYGELKSFTTPTNVVFEDFRTGFDRNLFKDNPQSFLFSLAESRFVRLSLAGASAPIVSLFDSEGNLIASTTHQGDFEFSEDLDPGNYELRIADQANADEARPVQLTIDAATEAKIIPNIVLSSTSSLNSPRTKSLTLTAKGTKAISGFASVMNLGNRPERIVIAGPKTGKQFSASYFTSLGNITAQVAAGRFKTEEINLDNARLALRCQFTLTRKSARQFAGGSAPLSTASDRIRIIASSSRSPRSQDKAQFFVKTRRTSLR